MAKKEPDSQAMKRILISRTDSIGDVVLTLPLAGYLKKKIPDIEIQFLGSDYTAPIIEASANVDAFYSWDSIKKLEHSQRVSFFKQLQSDAIIHVFPNREIAKYAKIAGIKNRVGSSHRLFHYLTCNKVIHFSRRFSELHEAQLNFRLLKPLGLKYMPGLEEIGSLYGFNNRFEIPDWLEKLLTPECYNIILHPKSKGSAREWGLENFQRLIDLLNTSLYNVFITGTAQEGKLMGDFLSVNARKVHDLTGKLTLGEMVGFINRADGIVACSTGPLHLAAANGKVAIGVYPPIHPMHPGRWAPIGFNTDVIVADKECNKCRGKTFCECVRSISAEAVVKKLIPLLKKVKNIDS